MEASNFFSRLLKQPKSITQQLELDDIGEFDKAWRAVQDTLEHPDERQLIKGIQSTDVPKDLTHIVDALVHESNQIDEETLGGCMEYFVNHDLLGNLERLSGQDKPHGIKSEVLKALNNLIVLLPDRFLVHNSVHRPLRRLLKSCIGDAKEEGDVHLHGSAKPLGAAGIESRSGEELEGDLVDLMCVLCSRMRAYPPLLLIFFHDKGWLKPEAEAVLDQPLEHTLSTTAQHSRTHSLSTKSPSTSTRGRNFEFLLFSYLLHFIHREGKTGDFARAGLLFLFDIAFHTLGLPTKLRKGNDDSLLDARRALAGYILDGDFTDVMAASLGAVWSLLPSKLRVPTLGEIAEREGPEDVVGSGGMVLGKNDEGNRDEQQDMVQLSTDEDVQDQIQMLLKLLGFLQDIIMRCIPVISMEEGFETDSDMESDSDEMSGAKPTPIIRIGMALADSALESIQSSFFENVLYPSILECSPQDGSSVAILTYLDILFSNLDDGRLYERLLDFLLPFAGREDDGRFTIRDLIIDNLQSGRAQAQAAALRLLRTMMVEHCSASSGRLLQTIGPGYTPDHRVPTNSNEPDMYASLVERLDPSLGHIVQSTSYASYLADAHSMIQSDICFERYQYFKSAMVDGPPIGKHQLKPDNVTLQILLRSLGRMLGQGPDENVALTGVIVTLASCPFRSLEGWLTYDTEEVDLLADSNKIDYDKESEINPFIANKLSEPAIYQIISSLISQIASFRGRIPNFDILLSERRQGLLYTDNLDEAMNMNVTLDVDSSSVFGSPTPTPLSTPQPKRKGMMGTLASYLTPVRTKSTSGSPAPTTPQRRAETIGRDVLSPHKIHYESVVGQEIEAVPSPVRNGIWSSRLAPEKIDSTSESTSIISRPGSSLANTTHAYQLDTRSERGLGNEKQKVSLSDTLDNCIILEEFVKELVAVMGTRRALGVDPISFL